MFRVRNLSRFRRNYILLFLVIQVFELWVILNFNIGGVSVEEMSKGHEGRKASWMQSPGWIVGNKLKLNSSGCPVSLQSEKARRKLETTSNEFWYYLKHQLNSIQQDSKLPGSINRTIELLLNTSRDYQSTIQSDFDTLKKVDRLEDWRFRESLKLGRLVQNRLRYLQNPPDCSVARKLVCTTLICGQGFGCSINHYAMCLIVAYATQRTLIIPGDFTTYLEPLSETCTTFSTTGSTVWREGVENFQTVFINVDKPTYKPDFLPLAVPDDLADRLERFHGDPVAWWIGQITAYIFRPTKITKSYFALKMDDTDLIVGLHIRRTDKQGEAKFHSVEEYMGYVEEWFNARAIQNPGLKRKIFLATDSNSVIKEIQQNMVKKWVLKFNSDKEGLEDDPVPTGHQMSSKGTPSMESMTLYPNYEVLSNSSIASNAIPQTRRTEESKFGIINDIYYLSKCDFLVCTFSSNVCRMAYALMQTRNGDASRNVKSLDDIFYMNGQNDHYVRITETVSERLEIGRKLVMLGNHWDGNSKVIDTNEPVLVPTYKLIDEMVRAKMPSYPNVDENTFSPFSLWEDLNKLN